MSSHTTRQVQLVAGGVLGLGVAIVLFVKMCGESNGATASDAEREEADRYNAEHEADLKAEREIRRHNAEYAAAAALVDAAIDAPLTAKERAEVERQRKADEAAAKKSAALRPARIEFVKTIGALFASDPNRSMSFAIGEPDTMLRVTSACNAQILALIVETAGDPLRKVGFETLACADMSASEPL